MFATAPYPLQLFHSLQERLFAQHAEGTQRLTELLKGVEASVDNYRTILPALSRRREEAIVLLQELDARQFLIATLKAAIRRAELSVHIPDLRDRIAFYENSVSLWNDVLSGLPSRMAPEEQMEGLVTQLESLRSAGSTDTANHQRHALRAIKTEIPPLGREDLNKHRADMDQLHMTLALERAEMQRLLAQTPISLRVQNKGLAVMLEALGLEVFEVSDAPADNAAATVEAADGSNG